MSRNIESRLRRAFIANGGTEEEFASRKSELLSQYRDRATIDAVLEEATRPLSMNDLIRDEWQGRRDDGLAHLFRQTGDDAA